MLLSKSCPKKQRQQLECRQHTPRCLEMCSQEVETRDVNNSTDVRNDISLIEAILLNDYFIN